MKKSIKEHDCTDIDFMKLAIVSALLLFMIIGFARCSDNRNSIPANPPPAQEEKMLTIETKTILFFGNSLTAGYGLEDPSQSFPSLVQDKIDSLNLQYKVINAGVSGETSAGGNGRIEWILKQPVDVFVLELGANDGLRGIPVAETKKNLQSIIGKVRAKYPAVKVLLAGMMVPPNMGDNYATGFRSIYPQLARENNIPLIPFILEGVGGVATLNQRDGIHPTAEGHRILAENVWDQLATLLQ